MTEEFISAIQERFEVNEFGHLTESGFITLMLQQTAGDPNETFKDLEKLGYDSTLSKIITM